MTTTLTQKLKKAHMVVIGLNLPLMTNLIGTPIPGEKRYNPVDTGINKKLIDETGKVVETVKRKPGSDTTVTRGRWSNGVNYKLIEAPINYEDGVYEIKKNVPIIL